MNSGWVELVMRVSGGLLAFATLAVVLYGIWRGARRQAGVSVGRSIGWLRAPWFYPLATVLFLAACYWGWVPLPLVVSPAVRSIGLLLGGLLYFPGLAFVLWGRFTLGRNYFVSTGLRAQLFADHQLVTRGPFAIVRHPMYAGLFLAALGSLLIYATWTTLLFACCAPLLALRARREEMALAAQFGDQWQAYRQRVPAFFPRFLRQHRVDLSTANPRHNLKGVSETLLIPLYARAVETGRPGALIRDHKAVELVKKLECDSQRLKLHGHDEIALILRVREFDRRAQEFLDRSPDGVVIHVGCGLDTRFERVDNGCVEWFDLDLPEVIRLREEFIGGEGLRYHLLGSSVFAVDWLEELRPYRQRPVLFLAEGVLAYFDAAQVKALVLRLGHHFPLAELVTDAYTPFAVWTNNIQLVISRVDARLRWGLKHGTDVEKWGPGISMVEEWFYYESPEPRWEAYRWMRFFPLLGKSAGIFHYQLGQL